MNESIERVLASHGRTAIMTAVLVALALLFAWVALRAGPLAPVPVSVAEVERESVTPSLFGIGTVQSRYTHKIGPTITGRLGSVDVQIGERVSAGQRLGAMDPVDFDDRIAAHEATLKHAEANVLAMRAQVEEVGAREALARSQSDRYENLLSTSTVSKESAEVKRQEWRVTQASQRFVQANLDASHQDLARLSAELAGLHRQRANLQLVSPVDGLVTRRDADPGTTVVAGQTVVEIVEPDSLWINVRFDQQRAQGLKAGLAASIVLRSRADAPLAGRVVRIEPYADPVTEELLAKVAFVDRPDAPPPIGELAEVTVALNALDSRPVVTNASVQRVEGALGVWLVRDGQLRFAPVRLGAGDLEGSVQVLHGLDGGEQVIIHSRRILDAGSRIKVVESVVDRS